MKNGFSLVELSIVLVILGLLTGGILGGRELIRAAELRSITSEKDSIATAVHTFRTKYLALPGDMRNATQFWGNANTGAIGGECANSYTDTGTGTQTCNGNNSGTIADGPNITVDSPEFFRFWQHLANANLIAGNYTGTQGTTARHHIGGVNAMTNKAGAVWQVFNIDDPWPGTSAVFAGYYRSTLLLGRESTNSYPNGVFLTPSEAWNIDKKIDDGKPGKGNVIAPYTTTCSNGAGGGTDVEVDYALQASNQLCVLYFTEQW